MKHDQSISDYYATTMLPGKIARLTGVSKYLVKKMVAARKFPVPVLNKLLEVAPMPTPAIPSAAVTAATETTPTPSASPEAPALTSAIAAPETHAPSPTTAPGDELRGAAVATEAIDALKWQAQQRLPQKYEAIPAPPFVNLADPLPLDSKCMILMAGRNVTQQTLYCVNALVEIGQGKIVFGEPESWYDVFMNRNRLVHRFLQSGMPWSFWLDPDQIVPCERPEWYRRNVPASRRWAEPLYSGMNAINRLASHHLKGPAHKMVGATYFDRFGRGVPIFASGRENADQRAMLNNAGPRDALVSAGRYVGSGALLVHRQVYLDIMEKVPMAPQDAADLKAATWEGYTYDFFGKLRYQGDDVSFSERARLAGHQPMVDLAVFSAHIGDYAYTNERINPDA